ncbi:MAG TPA: 2-amino-4-hydroxy-6-hydroxymethyldihydropteridine diphosphokinase [Rhizomicrobium sp.]|jgi:2-amino-4-hydroxy-6-hydroxymethyldihydropteridine diphosphokinase|nr:2-amino-4-hydroxy-6-hydroxymethyldihydropteridine diphosphokinase [Rhizomicrobium sp.]
MILIALGANLPSPAGPPADSLRAALDLLARQDVFVCDVSAFYRSPAWPDPRDPPFVNAVARVETPRGPADLLRVLKELELAFGRSAARQNAPRPLDLDILDYEGVVQAGPPILPHPRLQERGFVLIPLRDVAPGWSHPVSGRDVTQLVDALPRQARELTSLA